MIMRGGEGEEERKEEGETRCGTLMLHLFEILGTPMSWTISASKSLQTYNEDVGLLVCTLAFTLIARLHPQLYGV